MRGQLLSRLKAKDIRALQADVNFLRKGYLLFYCIDTYDVINYCFPFGINGDQQKSIDLIGDEQVAYNLLFEHISQPFLFLLFSEYKIEFINSRNRILDQEREVDKLNNLKDYIGSKLREGPTNERKQLIKQLQDSYTFLLTYAKLHRSSVERFKDLLISKLNFDDDLIDRYDISTSIQNIITTAQRSKWSSQVFSHWVNRKRHVLERLRNPMAKMDNMLRDILVIERVAKINAALIEKNEKAVFFVFSSARRMHEIFCILEEENDIDDIGITKFFKTQYNSWSFLHRNLSQAYLLSLIWSYDRDEDQIDFKKIELTLRELETATEKYLSIKNEATKDFFKKLEAIISKIREELERSNILRQIDEVTSNRINIQRLLSEFADEKTLAELKAMFEKLLNEADEGRAAIKADLATTSIKTILASNEKLLNILQEMQQGNVQFNIEKGSDSIRGTYHHLPILLFQLKLFKSIPYPSLNQLVDLCIASKQKRDMLVQDPIYMSGFRDVASSFLTDFQSKSFLNSVQSNLINIFVYLLTPIGARQTTLTKDGESFNREIFELLEELSLKAKHFLKDLNNDEVLDTYLELLYFQLWAARRCCLYEVAWKFAIEGVKLKPQDPRFIHGQCLVRYSMIFPTDGKKQPFLNPQALQEVIGEASNAIDLYDQWAKPIQNFTLLLIQCSIVSLKNLQAHCLALLFQQEHHESKMYLSRSRHLINSIKQFEKNNGNNYQDYPEYLHTESFVELQEAILLKKSSQVQAAKEKLIHAESAINKAINIISSDLYLATKISIEMLLKNLNRY